MNHSKKIALMIVSIASMSNAYEFSFFNDTDTPLAIAIRIVPGISEHSEEEPLYKFYVKPGAMNSFVPGKHEVPDIKWSFCLDTIYYMKNPTMAQRAFYFANAVWRKVHVTWVNAPLSTTKEPYKLPKKHKLTTGQRRLVTKRKKVPTNSKSMCRDRHFEITENEHGMIVVKGSLVE